MSASQVKLNPEDLASAIKSAKGALDAAEEEEAEDEESKENIKQETEIKEEVKDEPEDDEEEEEMQDDETTDIEKAYDMDNYDEEEGETCLIRIQFIVLRDFLF